MLLIVGQGEEGALQQPTCITAVFMHHTRFCAPCSQGVQGDVELMHCHFEHDTLLAGGARDGRGNSSFSVKPSAVSLTRRANSGSSLR